MQYELLESNHLVAYKIYSAINKESKELGKIFIEMKKFHQYKKEHKLSAVGHDKSYKEEQYLTLDAVLFCFLVQRKNPVLAPKEVVYLCGRICRNIGYHIVKSANMHKHPYHQRSNHCIESTHYDKPYDTYCFFH